MSNKTKLWGVSILVLAFSFNANAQTCVPHPTCVELGYNKKESDCGKNATVRCPFNKAEVFCTAYTDKEGTTLPQPGDILFSDKTWGPELRSDKRAIGVVVDGSGLAINLHSINLTWGTPGSQLSLGTDGKYNTSKIVEHLTSKGYSGDYAAKYCKGYTSTQTNPGDWYLPSEYETDIILRNIGAINKGLLEAKGIAMDTSISSCSRTAETTIECRIASYVKSLTLMTSNQYSSDYGLHKTGRLIVSTTEWLCSCSTMGTSSDYCGSPVTMEKCRNQAYDNINIVLDSSSSGNASFSSYPTRCVFQFK